MTPMVKVNNRTPERCHAVFIFNFEHMQINLIFLLLTLNRYASWAWDKSTKQLKWTLNKGQFL